MQFSLDDTIFVDPERVEEKLKEISDNICITKGSYRHTNVAAPRDLDWNHMDPHHRPHIHNTYTEAARLCTSPIHQVSVTRPSKKLPFLMCVTDVMLRPNLFFQTFTIFNMLFVLCVIRSYQENGSTIQQTDWYIVSKPVFKFLHGYFSRRLLRLNKKQNDEDLPVRNRRFELRKLGYRFRSDDPNYILSSSLESATIPPKLSGSHTVELKKLNGELGRFSVERLDFVYRPDGSGGWLIWPAVCPHEGGPLDCNRPEGHLLRCPWHGIKFRALALGAARSQGTCGGAKFTLEDGRVRVEAA